MHLLLGKLLNIFENKKKLLKSFFGKVKKPKFKHKKGGGGEPGPELKKLIRVRISSIISLSTLKVSSKSVCRIKNFRVLVTSGATKDSVR